MKNKKAYEESLNRLLHELKDAISERNAYNKLHEITPRTSWTFLRYAAAALYNDMIARAIKILDKHNAAASFWFLYSSKKTVTEEALSNAKLSMAEIETLTEKLMYVRNNTHFHINKNKPASYKEVWKKADIKGRHINKVFNGLWKVFNILYEAQFEESFPHQIYDGGDVLALVKAIRKVHE
jgi:hypothetical protein